MLIGLKNLAGSGLAGTIGAATSARDLTRKCGRGGSAAIDLAHEKTRTLAKTAIAMDVTSIGLQCAALILSKTHPAGKSLSKLAGSASRVTPFARSANSMSFALQVSAGMVEFEIARRTGDAARASHALGNTVGSLGGGLGGAKLGAAIGTILLPGIGTAVGGFTGAVAGSWGGCKLGRECSDRAVKDWLHQKFT